MIKLILYKKVSEELIDELKLCIIYMKNNLIKMIIILILKIKI